MNPGKMRGVDTPAASGRRETVMLHPEGGDKGFVRSSGLFALDGRNAGEALGANG